MKPMSGESFFEREGKPYCKEDFENIFAAKCNGCQKPISDKAIVALEAKWHKDCFKCKVTDLRIIYCSCEHNVKEKYSFWILYRPARNRLRLTHLQWKTTNRYVHHVPKQNQNLACFLTRDGFPIKIFNSVKGKKYFCLHFTTLNLFCIHSRVDEYYTLN